MIYGGVSLLESVWFVILGHESNSIDEIGKDVYSFVLGIVSIAVTIFLFGYVIYLTKKVMKGIDVTEV